MAAELDGRDGITIANGKAEECGMATDKDRIQNGILGDINPVPSARDQVGGGSPAESGQEDDEAMAGGSKHDRAHHSGSRDVTEGVTGGVGTEVGGTRNFRQGTGATGGDIGNRPE
jgi:hypothetical protein